MGGSNYYYGTLYVASEPSFSNIIYSYQFSPNVNCRTIPGGTLQDNHWYWWKIGVVCPHGTTGSSSYNFLISISGLNKIETEISNNFNLLQNYPNPFNPSTKIKFDIAKSSITKLIIYDILGREVATLVNEELKPGSYEYEWNGSNFASGVYFYKLETSDYQECKKMILLK